MMAKIRVFNFMKCYTVLHFNNLWTLRIKSCQICGFSKLWWVKNYIYIWNRSWSQNERNFEKHNQKANNEFRSWLKEKYEIK